ncbi:MAG: hypothetical protein ABR541_04380 [Candidatus Dormibacteria bacterium]
MPMPESSAGQFARVRPEPFVGVAVVLSWLLASGGVALVAVGQDDAQAAGLYAQAPTCAAGTRQPTAGTEPANAAQATALECKQQVTVTLRETSAPALLPDHVTVAIGPELLRVDPASPRDAQLLASVPAGTQLAAVRWRGRLTELDTPFGTARAADDPAAAAAADRLAVAALFALAAVLALVGLGPALARLGRGLRRLVRRPVVKPRVVITPPAAADPQALPFRRVS